MIRPRLNESGQVGPAVVFFLLILLAALFIFVMTPVIDEIENAQADQIADGEPVSVSRIESLNNMNTIWEALPFVLTVLVGLWYWITALRERGGSV